MIKYRNTILGVLLALISFAVHAQASGDVLKKRVTIYRNETRVDSFFNLLARQTGVGFSFNSKKISPSKLVPIQKGSYTVEECLLKIQQASGIHYALMNNHIILVDNPPQEKYRLQLVKKKPVTVKPAVKKTTPVVTAVVKDKAVIPRDTVVHIDSTVAIKVADPIKQDTTPSIQKATAPQQPAAAPASVKIRNEREKDWNILVGVSALKPDFYDLFGIGVQVQYEKQFNSKWSWTGAVAYHYIMGSYNQQFTSATSDSVGKDFAHMPVMIGLRRYLIPWLYLSFETGWSVRTSSKVGSFMSFSPSVGGKLPLGNSMIDINANYFYMKDKPTYDKPRLQKGNLGFWCLRFSYAF